MSATADSMHFAAPDALTHEVGRWERLLWDLRLDCSTVRDAVSEVSGHVKDRLFSTDVVGDYLQHASELGAETFGRLYSDPAESENPVRWAKTFQDALDELPEWERLRDSVRGDADFAALATARLLGEMADKIGELAEMDAEDPQGRGEPCTDQAADAIKAGVRAVARRACDETADEVEQVRGAMNGVLPGSGHVPAEHAQRDPRRLELAEALAQNPDVCEVFRRAGRLRRIAERKAQEDDPQARQEVVGIERGADVSRLLPTELAYLSDKDLEDVAYMRIIERSALQYRLHGTQTLGRGPIVLLVDESGSMSHGDRHVWARAVVVAAIGQAVREKREVRVVYFDTALRGIAGVERDGSAYVGSVKVHGAQSVVLDAVTRTCGGGTDFTPAFRYAVDHLEAGHWRSDLLFVTDGMATIDHALAQKVATLRERGTRVFGLTVGGGSTSPAVQALCDECVDLDSTPIAEVEARLAGTVPVRVGS